LVTVKTLSENKTKQKKPKSKIKKGKIAQVAKYLPTKSARL
jgi:hypothetical protein